MRGLVRRICYAALDDMLDSRRARSSSYGVVAVISCGSDATIIGIRQRPEALRTIPVDAREKKRTFMSSSFTRPGGGQYPEQHPALREGCTPAIRASHQARPSLL